MSEEPNRVGPGEQEPASEDIAAVVRRSWQAVLRQPEVADNDNFFAVGNSMLAVGFMARLRKELGVQLPVALVFEHPRFAELVGELGQWLARSAGPASITASDRTSGPVSWQQEELLRVEAMVGPSPVNNVVVVLAATLQVRPDLLRRALQWVVNRHPALRLTFRAGEQVVMPPVTLPEIELTVADDPGDEMTIRRALRKAHLLPFDLDRGNLLRAQLFRRTGHDLLALHLHHLCVDGVSQSLLLDDLSAAYEAFSSGETPPAPAGVPSYLDYAAWQRSEQDRLLARARPYWQQVVTGLAARRVAADHRPRAVRYHRCSAEVSAETVKGLRDWATAEGATDFVVLAAAIAAAIDTDDPGPVGVGTLLDNRSHAAVEQIVGPLATSTLLAVDIATAGTPRALVRAVWTQLTEARRWTELPLTALLDQPCAELGLEPADLVDVVVALNQPYRHGRQTRLPLTQVPDHGVPLVTAGLDGPPSVSLLIGPDEVLVVSAEAAGADPAVAQSLADSVASAVRTFAAAPDTSLARGAAVAR
jgi:hypothetical protein